MIQSCAAIVIAAKHHELTKVKDTRGTTHTVGAIRCRFEFRTADWDYSAKTAMFCNGDAILHPEVANNAIAVPLDEDNECAVPTWRNDLDYTNVPVGSPVICDGQVYGLLQPHNAAHYPDTTPAMLAALWRVKHTTNPDKAKPYVKPTSTSDMYLVGECMIWTDGAVMKAVRDTIYSPAEYAADWELVN